MGAAQRRLRVLVVEDDERVRSLIADVLKGTAEVHQAVDVDEARRVIAATPRRRFDLAIVDCLLPGPGGRSQPGGVDLVGAIHAERPAVPIIAITGADEADALIVSAFRNGARDVVRKPFGIDEFLARVGRLVRGVTRRRHARSRATDNGVARVLAFLAEHVGQPVSLGSLATMAEMSRSHLSRSFRGAVGMPLREYVRNLRVDHALQLLLATPRPSLTQVALEAGFYDLPHLDKAFRDRFGISPSEFVRRKGLAPTSPAPRDRTRGRRRARPGINPP